MKTRHPDHDTQQHDCALCGPHGAPETEGERYCTRCLRVIAHSPPPPVANGTNIRNATVRATPERGGEGNE